VLDGGVAGVAIAGEVGFDHHLVKPVDLTILKKLLVKPAERLPS
jgi:hypothetical protein